jgi:hypothetical protein
VVFNNDKASLAIIETWEDEYVSLQSFAKAVVARFYNDYSKIVKHEVNGTREGGDSI